MKSGFAWRWITWRKARAYVNKHHRHLDSPPGAIVSIGLFQLGELVGVAMIGRPPARMSDKGTRLEVTRLCVREGTRNGCSFLNTRAKRLIQALGCFPITKTLRSESGASLRASGWRFDGMTGGGSWSRRKRPRKDKHTTEPKRRWVA